MSNGPWYLEKKGKFYGPFSLERLKKYADSGTIKPKTMVSLDKRNLVALADEPTLWPQLEPVFSAGGAPDADAKSSPPPRKPKKTVPKPAKKPQTDQPPVEEDPKDRAWVVTYSGKTYGPYNLTQLQRFATNGKLPPETEVKRQGEIETSTLQEVLANGGMIPKEALQNPPAKKPEPRFKHLDAFKKEFAENHPRTKSKALAWLLLFGLLALGGLFFLKRAQKSGNLPDTDIKPSSRIVKLIEERPLPPFHDIFMLPLQYALNFDVQQVRNNHTPDPNLPLESQIATKKSQFLYEQPGGGPGRSYAPEPPVLELSYRFNNNLAYTYFANEDRLVYAVLVTQPGFSTIFKGGRTPDEVHPKAVEVPHPLGLIWRIPIADGVAADIVWHQDGDRFVLDHLLLYNRP